MTTRPRPTSQLLKRSEHRAKERVLTQADPARVRRSADTAVLKGGGTFLVADEAGDIPFELPHAWGLFFHDCRFLDGYVLTLGGSAPIVLGSTAVRSVETRHHLTNPDLRSDPTGPMVPKNTLAIVRERLLRDGAVHELLTVRNHGRQLATVRVDLTFRARFEDLFIVKGFVRGPRGELENPTLLNGARVELAYRGRDGRRRTTTLTFEPPPTRLDGDRATFEVTLAPTDERVLAVAIRPREDGGDGERAAAAPFHVAPTRLRHWLDRAEAGWMRGAATVSSSNPLFDRVFQRALFDLRLLRSRLAGRHFYAAGIPWFTTLFGRDAAVVGLQTLPYGSGMAGETLGLLAHYQATDSDEYRDAAPGKILHELRVGELAHLGVIPQSPAYYGTVDATPLFLILACQYVRWSGDLDLIRRLRPHLDAALGWIDSAADSDGDGYVDYRGQYDNGLVNQGWKDSGNAIVDAEGRLAEPPIALCEVQAYVYRAWRECASLFRALGDEVAADRLAQRATDLRGRFDADYWSERTGCYVLARHAGNRRADVVTSNAGHVLWGGLAMPERAASVVERLTSEDMFSGWGIRTLAATARAYNPMSYHLGSVWPHDNAILIAAFRRYGHDRAAVRLFEALFEAAAKFRDFRLPELFCGFPRHETESAPVRYPVACSPQAWAAGALPHALWNLLGLRPDALTASLAVRRPCLPDWLQWIEVRGVRIGGAVADLRFERRDGIGAIEVTADVREGRLAVDVDTSPTATSPDDFALGRAAAD